MPGFHPASHCLWAQVRSQCLLVKAVSKLLFWCQFLRVRNRDVDVHSNFGNKADMLSSIFLDNVFPKLIKVDNNKMKSFW